MIKSCSYNIDDGGVWMSRAHLYDKARSNQFDVRPYLNEMVLLHNSPVR